MTHSSLMATSSPAAMSVPWQRKKITNINNLVSTTQSNATTHYRPSALLSTMRRGQWLTNPCGKSLLSLFKQKFLMGIGKSPLAFHRSFPCLHLTVSMGKPGTGQCTSVHRAPIFPAPNLPVYLLLGPRIPKARQWGSSRVTVCSPFLRAAWTSRWV